ncbi:hypothetical protein CIB48_g11514, partial [Xylaria polymorpha]
MGLSRVYSPKWVLLITPPVSDLSRSRGPIEIRGAHICIKQHLSASSPTQIQASAPHVRVSAATRSPPVPQLVPSDRVVSVVAPHMRPRRPGTG